MQRRSSLVHMEAQEGTREVRSDLHEDEKEKMDGIENRSGKLWCRRWRGTKRRRWTVSEVVVGKRAALAWVQPLVA